MQTVLDLGAARVFYDGILTEPRLDRPEGLAVHRDGSVWCGGERGQIYRIEPDGSSMEQVVSRTCRRAEDKESDGDPRPSPPGASRPPHRGTEALA